MIPRKLVLRNFMCYRDELPALDFDGIQIACLSGENGAGKSALLDAMTWALWGQARLKSDDDLKSYPVIIVGDPKGFAQHQKLKTRAEAYVGKPLNVDTLADTVGKLIGFPERAAAAADEGGFDPGSLLEDDGAEVSIEEPVEEEGANAEADLAMVDSMFDEQPASAVEEEISLSTGDELESFETEEPAEKTVVGFMPQFCKV